MKGETFQQKVPKLEKELVEIENNLKQNKESRPDQRAKLNCLYELRRYRDAGKYGHEVMQGFQEDENDIQIFEILLKIFTKGEDWFNILNCISRFHLMELFNQNDFILDTKANCLCEEKNFEALEELVNANPDKIYLKYYSAKVLFYNKNYAAALTELEKIITLVSQDKQGKMYSLKAKLYLRLNKPLREICKTYEIARQLDPSNLENYKQLVKLNLLLGFENRKFTQQALTISQVGLQNIGKGELINNFVLHLYHIKALCRNYKRADATSKLNEVRDALLDSDTKNWLNKRTLIKVYRKYFEVFHMCRFMDIDFDSDVFSVDLNKEIGKGGFGTVYEGKLKGKEVSVKLFNLQKNITTDDDADDEENMVKLFDSIFKEITLMDILSKNCDFILKVDAMFFRNNYKELTLITKLCKGGDYSKILRNKDIQIGVKTRLNILLQLAKAIQHIHSFEKPYSHNDIKSLNVLFEEEFKNGGKNKIYLCDFGLADYAGEQVRGFTPNYTAPEILRGEEFDCTCDLYSFGVVIWESFARQTPFQGKKREEIIEMVSNGETLDINEMEPETPKEIVELTKNLFKDRFERISLKDTMKILEKAEKRAKN